MAYIALDIGSSFIKSALLDVDRHEISMVTKLPAPGKLPNPKNAYYEIDADSIIDTVMQLIQSYLRKKLTVEGILIATQMQGFLLTDGQGRPITPYIPWQDERCLEMLPDGSASYMEVLRELIKPADLRRTGLDLKPGLALCNLFQWLRTHTLPDGATVMFHTLGSYLIHCLTGRHACHLTNAAATGFADIGAGAWNHAIIEAAGGGTLKFPEFKGETEPCGYYASDKGPIPVFPDIGDHQASVLGSMAVSYNEIVLTIGTAGIMTRISNEPRTGAYEIRPYFKGEVLQTVTRIPGGRNLDVLIEFIEDVGRTVFGRELSSEQIWAQVLPAVQQFMTSEKRMQDQDREGIEVLGDLEVEVGFYKQQRGVEAGGIHGITGANLRVGSLFHAAFENMAEVYMKLMEVLCPDGGKVERLIFSGGVSYKNKPLIERIVQLARTPGVMSPIPDESLMGLLRLALLCSGRCSDFNETRTVIKASFAGQDDRLK
ncbi:sedoheptulokinase [Paenibacillus koleovorans]|uniref:sedoheptulokinase n=1 Tax=Paenibacillus koleovorans TaxID=121608 RepID=UPI000FDA55C7|nr:FGGY family carbohydrate kinase [Paenibacillus koleovorans]